MLKYEISANLIPRGLVSISIKDYEIKFDASSGTNVNLPNPAELLLTSLAAFILKNVYRYSEKLKIDYKKATKKVYGERNENPPFMNKLIMCWI